ncbi:hypothetical protein NL676_010882 [Syzygium grande]|nr:hypothetical protein NL676_010882 [Syzygium grande]
MPPSGADRRARSSPSLQRLGSPARWRALLSHRGEAARPLPVGGNQPACNGIPAKGGTQRPLITAARPPTTAVCRDPAVPPNPRLDHGETRSWFGRVSA